MPNRRIFVFAAIVAFLLSSPTAFASGINSYAKTNLVSDQAGAALVTDPLLVNPWGIASSAASPFWVANEGTSLSAQYQGDVSGSPFVKPALSGGAPTQLTVRLPTGIVAVPSGAQGFGINNTRTNFGQAFFIWASIEGSIAGWYPNRESFLGSSPQVRAARPGHVYTGLAIGNNGTSDFLYAADAANKKIDVYSNLWAETTLAGTFTDPTMPASYAPHNIQNIGGVLYVAYARVNPSTGVVLPGFGDGYVSKFDTNGNFLGRLVSNGPLNAPWALVMAPAGFGLFGGSLLVGNFGDGRINAFNPTTSAFLGTLNDPQSNPIVIDGLRALVFGNGSLGGDPNSLYFSSGPNAGKHGLVGKLTAGTSPAIVGTATTIVPTEFVAFSGVVAAFADFSQSGTYTATIHWDDGTSSAGVVTSTGSGGFLVNGTHTYGDEPASLPVGVTFNNTTSGSGATVVSNATISDAPLPGTPVSFTATVDVPFTRTVATFIDVDGKASDFTAFIEWGDGSASSGVVSGTGPFTVTGTHTYRYISQFTLRVGISDHTAFSQGVTVTATADAVPSAELPLLPASALLALGGALAGVALLMMRK